MKFLFALLLIVGNTARANNVEAEEEAIKSIVTATYKQSGIESNMNNYISDLEYKYIPPEHKELIGRVTIIVNTLVTQRLSVSWSF